MSETWPITEEGSLMIRQNATFDLEQLYKLFHTYATNNNYIFHEQNFTRKDKSDGSEYQIEWNLVRKVTPFIKFTVQVEIWSLRTTEIKENNKTLYKGELEITFDANMEMDWNKKTSWESKPFGKFFLNVYIYYLKKQYFLDYAGKFWGELYDLHSKVKTVLNQFTP